MDARITKAEAALLIPTPPSRRAEQAEALRLAAARQHKEATLNAIRRAVRATGDAIAAVAGAIIAWPARRATYERLHRLNDRELADIGLTRADIPRVFAADFANDNGARRAA